MTAHDSQINTAANSGDTEYRMVRLSPKKIKMTPEMIARQSNDKLRGRFGIPKTKEGTLR